ncbi:444_t:CDS:2, partial [Cetraspora pellucida]
CNNPIEDHKHSTDAELTQTSWIRIATHANSEPTPSVDSQKSTKFPSNCINDSVSYRSIPLLYLINSAKIENVVQKKESLTVAPIHSNMIRYVFLFFLQTQSLDSIQISSSYTRNNEELHLVEQYLFVTCLKSHKGDIKALIPSHNTDQLFASTDGMPSVRMTSS